MIVMVERWTAEEVGQHVVHSGPVLRADGQVVAQGQAVQLTEEASQHLAACRLPVDDVNVRAVVHVEQQRLTVQQRAVGCSAGHNRQQLAPRNLSVRVVEMSVFRGVRPAECSPYPEVLGPRC